MSIHRELKEIQDLERYLSDIKNSLILLVFGRIKEHQFSQFQEWADACMANDPSAVAKVEALLS